MSLKYNIIRAAFEVLSTAQVAKLFNALSGARGVIWTLHRVLPEPPPPFAPNSILQVTPDFLDFALGRLRRQQVDIISLDDALLRLAEPKGKKPFVVLTFDDGYRDNLRHALPILQKYEAPFTLYVPTAFPQGEGHLWWQAIEDIISHQTMITFDDAEGPVTMPTVTSIEQQAAFDRLYWRMRKMPEPERLALLHNFAQAYGYDLALQCRELIMNWEELKLLADDSLCTIGAHTVNHYELAKLDADEARAEMIRSIDAIEQHLGQRPKHFSYPLGGPLSCGPREFAIAKDIGLASAVTTRPGGLYAKHAHDPWSLPRVSLNGLFQEQRYVDVFASGGLFTQLGKLVK